MIIREFVMQDFARVMEINNASYEFPPDKSYVLKEIESGKAWVSEENGAITGFIIGKLKNNLPYINNVAVDREHRSKGTATKLIKQFESVYSMNQKPENKFYWLQVETDNPAQKLYFDLGYRAHWVDENYYGQGKHALCMYKSIRPVWNASN